MFGVLHTSISQRHQNKTMINIVELKTKKELKQFVKFPFKLYKHHLYWTPSIISDELNHLDPSINPIFKHVEARYFVAVKSGEWVGRIAVMINWIEVKKQKKITLYWRF